jgi:hypothetical protein
VADGNTYPARLQTLDGVVRESGSLIFNDSTNQPAPPAPPISSGTLPNTGAWVSGTAKVNPVSREASVTIEVVGDATNNIASCVIALSADNSTFTTLATVSLAAAVNNTGAITTAVQVRWPQGWYVKLTLSHTTVAASIYY